ncbi:helix-turn-helix domain-containing protein [Treponema succinifaciens]|uniref:helix-turn-helix domain-containing protein n=1 Tax=Treponema succinifaciens TaxID=167 RepID=UPI003FCE5B3F
MILEELHRIISERNIKQKDICKALNLSQSYTSELLNGKKDFSLDLLEKLCNFLEIEIKLIDNYR